MNKGEDLSYVLRLAEFSDGSSKLSHGLNCVVLSEEVWEDRAVSAAKVLPLLLSRT